MRWQRSRASENVEDRRAQGMGGMRLGGKGIGLGTVAIVVVAMLLGVDPGVILNMAGGLGGPAVEQRQGAATAIGDDRLQCQALGHVVPDSFTHGSSEQRVRWFRRGIESGDPNACNTFEARNL